MKSVIVATLFLVISTELSILWCLVFEKCLLVGCVASWLVGWMEMCMEVWMEVRMDM